MRLFIAINFNEATKSGLLAMGDELRAHSKRGNFCLPESLHLTLAFLDGCGAKHTVAIKAIMDAVDFQPFGFVIEHIGRFNCDGGDIWWAGVRENRALTALHGKLADKLVTAGFPLDQRKYSPHIALAREVITSTVPQQVEAFGETVSSIELMKSERIQGKLIYTAIYERQCAEQ